MLTTANRVRLLAQDWHEVIEVLDRIRDRGLEVQVQARADLAPLQRAALAWTTTLAAEVAARATREVASLGTLAATLQDQAPTDGGGPSQLAMGGRMTPTAASPPVAE